MFTPKTDRVKKLAFLYEDRIEELKNIFDRKTNIYIDWANVLGWQDKLDWHIDIKRLKQLLDSFESINKVKFYYGTLEGDKKSESFMQEVAKYKYEVTTKPVKDIPLSIDVSSINEKSPDILEDFISKPLFEKLDLETIKFLNNKLKELNKRGIKKIIKRKCNFDVEIGADMILDYERDRVDNFVLWSGDGDFVDPIRTLNEKDKKVYIFATARRVSRELNEVKAPIYDIQKIRNFICWGREIPQNIKQKLS